MSTVRFQSTSKEVSSDPSPTSIARGSSSSHDAKIRTTRHTRLLPRRCQRETNFRIIPSSAFRERANTEATVQPVKSLSSNTRELTVVNILPATILLKKNRGEKA